jgi:hypothetical protein
MEPFVYMMLRDSLHRKNPSVEQRRRMGQVMPHRANSTDGRRSKV